MWDTSSPGRDAIVELAKSLPKPRVVLCVTPHWLTKAPVVSSGKSPETIHDFGGFPEHYYKVQYPAPGSSDFAKIICEALRANAVECTSEDRGFDHATWQVCGLMWPDASVPIVQLSLQPHLSTEHHYKIGEILKTIVAAPDVMMIATGTWTHNLGEFFTATPPAINDKPGEYAVEFSQWMQDRVERFDIAELCDYRKLAPHAYRAHPTPDHILGLFVALGASAAQKPKVIHQSFVYGNLGMTHIRF